MDTHDATKTCPRCGLEKPMDEFNRYARTRDGRQGYCRACSSAYQKPRSAAVGAARAERAAARRLEAEQRPTRRCPGCEQWVIKTHFQKNQTYCRACSAVRQKAWRDANRERRLARRRELYAANVEQMRRQQREYMKANPDVARRASRKHLLKKKYGLTPEQFGILVDEQGGCCAICRQPFGDRRPHIDHCHATNIVRGILCSPCNTALGLLSDDPARMEAAAAYIRRSQEAVVS